VAEQVTGYAEEVHRLVGQATNGSRRMAAVVRAVQLDLSEKNAGKLRKALDPYLTAAFLMLSPPGLDAFGASDVFMPSTKRSASR
jgi:hypothetical protein